jgi:ABC-type sugar transport system ATPase subunit
MASSELRSNKMTCVIGTNGTGKTTFLKKLILQLLRNNRRVLIITPHDMEWETIPLVHDKHKQHIAWYVGARRIIWEDGLLPTITENFKNGALVFDDCRAYLNANTDRDLHRLLISRRQRDIDIFAVGHGFTEIPPKFFTFATNFVLFRTMDNIEKRKSSIIQFDRIKSAQEMVNEKAINDPYFKAIINV